MTQPPTDNASATAVDKRLQQIRERAAHAPTFYATTRQEEGITPRSLAELYEDGTWRYWDMRSPYSDEAIDFIANALADIRFLLDELDRRDRDNASLRAQLAAATGALKPFADIGLVEAYTVMTAIGRTETETLMKLAKQTATPPAGAANADGER